MSHLQNSARRSTPWPVRRGNPVWILGMACLLVDSFGTLAWAEKEKPKTAGGVRPVAVSTGLAGTLVSQAAFDQPWKVLQPKDPIPCKHLVVGLRGGILQTQNGAVRLSCLSDLDQKSPYPVKEAAFILHQNSSVDLNFTLDRGMVDLTNTKKKGPAKVRFQVRDQAWELVLREPQCRVALELYSRWPQGVRFTRKPSPTEVPVADLVILVLKGEVDLKHNGQQFALDAPPGRAMVLWDSDNGLKNPSALDKLPPWALGENEKNPVVKAKLLIIERFRQALVDKGVEAALKEFAQSKNILDRRMAVMAIGAFDQLGLMAEILGKSQPVYILDGAILSLRHWIGRGPGQDLLLYQGLIEKGKFSPVHAATVLQLLHSFGEEDLARPELYEMLIDFLGHEKLIIRYLAHWHLVRLVPQGVSIAYNPLEAKEKIQTAIQAWKTLVPPGSLPSRKPLDRK